MVDGQRAAGGGGAFMVADWSQMDPRSPSPTFGDDHYQFAAAAADLTATGTNAGNTGYLLTFTTPAAGQPKFEAYLSYIDAETKLWVDMPATITLTVE